MLESIQGHITIQYCGIEAHHKAKLSSPRPIDLQMQGQGLIASSEG